MTMYLVRHGLAAAGVDDLDPGLAPLGHEQAAAAAQALHSVHAGRGRLLVSPLRRTQETAAPIAAVLGLDPELCEEVAEVFDPSWSAEERAAMIGPFMAGGWSGQPERLRQWRDRVVAKLLEAGAPLEADGQDLVVVSHYIAIGVAIGEATGDDRVVPIPMANASITRIRVENGRMALIEAVSTAHLAATQITGTGQAQAGRAQ